MKISGDGLKFRVWVHSGPVFGKRALAWLLAVGAGLGGCAAAPERKIIEPAPRPPAGASDANPTASAPTSAEARAESIRRDPLAYLRQVAENCRALRQYTVTMTRQERRGLLNNLYGPERIACWFRREPFSVRMKWLDEDVKYGESTYVAGQRDDKVRFIPRHGFLGLAPDVTAVDLQTPVTWGEAKYPLTDFGLERMMEKTLNSVQRADKEVVVQYVGLVWREPPGRAVHHLHLEFPPAQYKAPIQEIYIDAATDLPAGTIIKYAPPSTRIDAAYFYDDLNPNAVLMDADFLLDAERKKEEGGAGPAKSK